MIYGYVYCGQVGGRTKIGRSGHPERRRRQIETASGIEFDQWQCWHVYAPAACERHLHARYAEHRGVGEWFDAPLLEALAEYLEGKTVRSSGKRTQQKLR